MREFKEDIIYYYNEDSELKILKESLTDEIVLILSLKNNKDYNFAKKVSNNSFKLMCIVPSASLNQSRGIIV